MNTIQRNPELFIEAIEQNRPVVLNKEGEWYVENWFCYQVAWFFGYRSDLVENFNHIMDQLEVELDESKQKAFLPIAERMDEKHPHWELTRRIEAMRYRLYGQKENIRLPIRLFQIAEAWKKQQSYIYEKELSEREKEVLKQVAPYKSFSLLLDKSTELQDRFFRWTFCQHHPPSAFVELPGTSAHVEKAEFGSRLANGDIKYVDQDLFIRFQDVWRSVRNLKQEITFSHNMKMALYEVYGVFRRRITIVGDLEVIPERGVCNYNPEHMGPRLTTGEYLSPKLEGNWWEKTAHTKVLSTEELLWRYKVDWKGNPLGIAEDEWVFSIANSAETTEEERMAGVHSCIEVAIPRDGRWYVYNTGLYADWFPDPSSIWQKIQFVFRVFLARLLSPDEMIYNIDRDIEHAPVFVVPPDKGREMMKELARFITKARNKELVFHLYIKSCVQFGLHFFEKFFPEEILQARKVCCHHPVHANPEAPLGTILRVCRIFSDVLPYLAYYGFSILGGGLWPVRARDKSYCFLGLEQKMAQPVRLFWDKRKKVEELSA